MRFLSVCSGIEAASVAWHPIGWKALAFSEIEAFPRAVLAHHYPDVPLHGDFTVLRDQQWIADADVLVGGTPCQAFSVAGLRQSLQDDRGNLTLEYVRLADAVDDLRRARGEQPAIVVWENVPGVLSVKDNAFGCFLAALVGNDAPVVYTGKRWTNAGLVIGPKRAAAWRVLDAQYFGVAQRRRRVFVVASARDGFDPAEVLFEREGVPRNTPPSRSQGQTSTYDVAPSLVSSGRGVERVGETRGQDPVVAQPYQIANCLTQRSHKGINSTLDEGQTPVITPTLRASLGGGTTGDHWDGLTIAFHPTQDPITSTDGTTHALGCGSSGGQASVAVAFSAKDYGGDATEELAPTLRSMGHAQSHANGGGQMAVAFHSNQSFDSGNNVEVSPTLRIGSSGTGQPPAVATSMAVAFDILGSLATNGGKETDIHTSLRARAPGASENSTTTVISHSMAVRRLTPRECERLQGFPDDYTLIPVRNKPAADGPRYKALGNSMAVPVMHWIGKRIQKHVEAIQ